MKKLLLDGSSWRTTDDVYDAFFRAVGAPEWHGRTLVYQQEHPAIDRRILPR
jgi:hypothetical protein